MNRKISLGVAGLAVIAAAGGYYLGARQAAGGGDFAYAATPAGINLEPVGQPLGYGPQRLVQPIRTEVTYTNDKDLTLYTRDDDQPGRSMCQAECAKNFIPAAPLPNARPVPRWTIVSRDDGAKQWAHDGQPLYTYVKDQKLGDIGGMGGAGGVRSTYGAPSFIVGKAPAGAKVAYFLERSVPVTGIAPPSGIKIEEVTDANAVALVDSRGMTLYAFDGDVDNDRLACSPSGAQCPDRFVPLVAPQLAHPSGDWTIVRRKDGIEQWAYKGKPLYNFTADKVVDEVNGIEIDLRYRVAAVETFYLPSNVTIQQNLGRGRVLATAQGMTLYRRDIFGFTPSAHQYFHGVPYRGAVGKAISVSGCDQECLKTFHPYLAPADAQPSGYWNILVRPDGSRQWTYKDFGLYTYDGDKKPGEMTGDDIYDLAVSADPNKVNDVGTPANGPAALYWTYAPL